MGRASRRSAGAVAVTLIAIAVVLTGPAGANVHHPHKAHHHPAKGKKAPKSPGGSSRPVNGGYYVGQTAAGKPGTADVSPDGKLVSAAQFHLDCGGQDTAAARQSMPIVRSGSSYHFSGSSGDQALLFTASSLAELGQVTVTGRFTSGHTITGTFRVTSATCGDSGSIGFALTLKSH